MHPFFDSAPQEGLAQRQHQQPPHLGQMMGGQMPGQMPASHRPPFSHAPYARMHHVPGGMGNSPMMQQQQRPYGGLVGDKGLGAHAALNNAMFSQQDHQHQHQQFPPLSLEQDFPALGGPASGPSKPSEFVMQQEDFPALDGRRQPSKSASRSSEADRQGHSPMGHPPSSQPPPIRGGGGGGVAAASSAPHSRSSSVPSSPQPSPSHSPSHSPSPSPLPGSPYAHHAQQFAPGPPPHQQPPSPQHPQAQAQPHPQPVHQQRENEAQGQAGNVDQYGMLGLLHVIRMTNQDLNTLALGIDLTTLGLNLNSPECLHSTFVSPWADSPARRDPEFLLPMCYYTPARVMKAEYLSKFRDDTLMFVFYNMPRDAMQVLAAKELYSRGWQYHKEFKMWFTRTPESARAEGERAQFVYFDVPAWTYRPYHPSTPAPLVFMSEAELSA